MRASRFRFFRSLLATVPRPLTVLDVGGTQAFWQKAGCLDEEGIHITLVNLKQEEVTHAHLASLAGDATDLSCFEAREFDIVFSNSVIEHVGSYDAQAQMATEMRRVGHRYFVQTPNRYFPLEPHFLVPGFQFFPTTVQVHMVRRFNLGWYKKIPDRDEALDLIQHHRLLGKQEFMKLFPEAQCYEERVLGLTKSFIAYGGWDEIETED